MYFTLLVVVILTAIALVAVALGIARVHTTHKREKLTNVVFLRGDGRGCNSK